MGEIILQRTDGSGSQCPFTGQPVTMGRGTAAQLRIVDEFISRVHCEVILRGNDVVIRDLKSHNGTFVNGQAVQERVLATGDKIQIGVTPLEYRSEEKTVQPEKTGEPVRRELRAVFRVIPGASPQPSPSETVRIALPELPQAKT